MTLAAGVLTPAAAVSQGPVPAEHEAFAAVARAGEAVERAGDGDALWRAARQAVAAAEQAATAFLAADRARDAALVAYRAAYREALAGAVTCENGYPCTNGRVDPFEGFTAAFAAHFDLIAAVSAANAVYVDAVGIPGADAARARAVRVLGLAARMRGPDAVDEPGRWNALVGSIGAEINAGNALHRRATEARYVSDLALVDDVTRVMGVLYTAANRAPAGARIVSAPVMRAALDAAQDAMESLRSRIAAAAASAPDVVPGGAEETVLAGDVVPGGPPESTVSGNDVPGAPPEATRPGNDVPGGPAEAAGSGNDDAPGVETAPPAPRPADDVGGWAGALTAAARAAEQAAADAEAAAAGPGSSSSRVSSCADAEARATAAATRVTSLTIGDDRPPDVSARTGRETYSDLYYLLDAARRRARAACSSLER